MVLKLSTMDKNLLPPEALQSNVPQPAQKNSEGILESIIKAPYRFGTTLGAEIGSGGLGISEAALKGAAYLAGEAGAPETKDFISRAAQNAKSLKEGIYQKPFEEERNTLPGKAGEFTGVTAQFAAPSKGILVAGGKLGKASAAITSAAREVPVLGKVLGPTAKAVTATAAKFLPEAVGSGLVELGRTGGDVESAKTTGLFAGGTTTFLAGAGALARATYWPDLQKSVTTALGLKGKTTGGRILPQVQQKVTGLAVLKQYAENPAVNFDYKNASFESTIQAWNATRKYVYNKYADISASLGKEVKINVSSIVDDLTSITKDKRTGIYKDAAQSKIDDLLANFSVKDNNGSITYIDASPKEIEGYLKDLYEEAGATLAGRSDKAHGNIASMVATRLRGLLDDSIEASAGAEYTALRSEYAALKSIEQDLVGQFQKEARKVGGGLTDYMNIITSGDLISGILFAQPQLFVKGAAQTILSNTVKSLKQYDRYLRRSFNLIDAKDASDISKRFFGSPF